MCACARARREKKDRDGGFAVPVYIRRLLDRVVAVSAALSDEEAAEAAAEAVAKQKPSSQVVAPKFCDELRGKKSDQPKQSFCYSLYVCVSVCTHITLSHWSRKL